MMEDCSPMKTDIIGAGTRPSRLAAVYGMAILGTVALFFVIRAFGESLTAAAAVGPVTAQGPSPPVTRMEVLMPILLALLTIIVTCRIMGSIFRYLGQPPVIGEVLAG